MTNRTGASSDALLDRMAKALRCWRTFPFTADKVEITDAALAEYDRLRAQSSVATEVADLCDHGAKYDEDCRECNRYYPKPVSPEVAAVPDITDDFDPVDLMTDAEVAHRDRIMQWLRLTASEQQRALGSVAQPQASVITPAHDDEMRRLADLALKSCENDTETPEVWAERMAPYLAQPDQPQASGVATTGEPPKVPDALERQREILREGTRIAVSAIDEFREAVRDLFALRNDGPCLAERRPTQDSDCLMAFQRLNDSGARLAAIADKLREVRYDAGEPPKGTEAKAVEGAWDAPMVQLSEMLRGLEIGPEAVTWPASMLFSLCQKIAAQAKLATPEAKAESGSDEMVKRMVNRFLGWRLPKPWHPDNGISYKRPNYAHPPADHDWPVGTNLFSATEVEAMIRYMLDGAVVREGETKPFDTTSPCGDPNVTVMARDAETGEPVNFMRRNPKRDE
jgi:hypothetical protein